MSRAEPPEDPLYETACEVAEAAEALMDVWERSAQSAPPRLSALQLRALVAVRGSPRMNLTRLAEDIDATAPATSRLCDRLEAAGLLRRDRGDSDRREIVLALTAQGRQAIDALAEQRCHAIHEVLERMPSEQCRELVNGLRAFTRASGRASPVREL
ncbi:MarR family winged helix-turn-helix transcriptional regulator [Streptomyces antarcticus]|uniref:MarR family winged helix-turn-helix transcriptional regulator n=1 Tax=Streptomyces antarcticus TaxID=2996458 RepID=UPI00226F4E78|nr:MULTISPECIES: MarR family winged helix-turn-helix transcriptional regulator [unclassified Streptomyces]MCY0939842.1 MarR family winged helix-turn-helix transcriptional regulator [Streptomyces sp. H34-AA3]MCY0949937.1 MarR family winged helix-turn-helix transcriptional regulator [Streptomyces sp. H27-S2]MCZ4081012.1 MarR family winged helix-turn-helix transcriptional regulator [Streptomyces sp. H34-S5]